MVGKISGEHTVDTFCSAGHSASRPNMPTLKFLGSFKHASKLASHYTIPALSPSLDTSVTQISIFVIFFSYLALVHGCITQKLSRVLGLCGAVFIIIGLSCCLLEL